MNKREVEVKVEEDWIAFVCNNKVSEIVKYFQQFPSNAEFRYDAGYSTATGELYYVREETDEELVSRMQRELKVARGKLARENRNKLEIERKVSQLEFEINSIVKGIA